MKKILPIALVIALSGCAQQSFTLQPENNERSSNEVEHHFLISGLGQSKTVDAAAVCNGEDNVVKVESQQTFTNGVLAVITLGIYTPREARVYCSV